MRNNPVIFILIFISIILAIDFYFYSGVKKITAKYSQNIRRIVWFLVWIIPFLLISGLLLFSSLYNSIPPSKFLMYFHFISSIFILFYIPKTSFLVFNLLDDIFPFAKKIINRFKTEKQEEGREHRFPVLSF